MWKEGIYLKVLGLCVTSWISAGRVIIYDAIFTEKIIFKSQIRGYKYDLGFFYFPNKRFQLVTAEVINKCPNGRYTLTVIKYDLNYWFIDFIVGSKYFNISNIHIRDDITIIYR